MPPCFATTLWYGADMPTLNLIEARASSSYPRERRQVPRRENMPAPAFIKSDRLTLAPLIAWGMAPTGHWARVGLTYRTSVEAYQALDAAKAQGYILGGYVVEDRTWTVT